MEILTIIIAVALVALALALIAYPLWQQTRPQALFKVNRAGQTLEEYQARYHAALVAIKDLMFDYEMGKVSTDDYDTLLARVKLEAAEIRREIDRLNRGEGNLPLDAALEQEIKALVAHTRQQANNHKSSLRREVDAEIALLKELRPGGPAAGAGCPNCGAAYQPGDAFCSSCGQALPAHSDAIFCAQCGTPAQPGDAFCSKCGTALGAAIPTPSPRDFSA